MNLDILQNPLLRSDLNACLAARKTQNLSPLIQSEWMRNQNDLEALSGYFGGESGGNFGFLSGDFAELFLRLGEMRIGFALSNHQQAYQAYKLCSKFCDITPILPDSTQGIILDVPLCDVYILPYVNQDLLTRNPIATLKEQILSYNPDALIIIDVSYMLAMGETLDVKIDDHTIFLCDGESLGFLRGYGVFLSFASNIAFFPPTRYVDGFYRVFLQEIERLQSAPCKEDVKEAFFYALQSILLDNVSLFAPLSSSLPNTLPLRLKGIKARSLLQSLYLDCVFAINGQECLFGFRSPSFVLQEMGYSQQDARELLSLSFDRFDLETVQKLAVHYQNLRNLEL